MYYIKMRPIEIKSDTTANVVCPQVPVRVRVPYSNKFPLASRCVPPYPLLDKCASIMHRAHLMYNYENYLLT